ncbi:MAG: hypothetical protein ABIP39_06570 [Polyangiaceae bacterium]
MQSSFRIGERGYTPSDFKKLRELGADQLESPDEIRTIIDRYGYLDDWKTNYRIQSATASLHNSKITCIDAAIFSYGLLELFYPDVKRRLLAIHRRDEKGEECGHCVTLYWNDQQKIGSFSKSSFVGLGHREAVFPDEMSIATSYAQAYVKMGYEPLYFGVTTLEEAAPEIDWRFDPGDLSVLSSKIQSKYEYAFMLAR